MANLISNKYFRDMIFSDKSEIPEIEKLRKSFSNTVFARPPLKFQPISKGRTLHSVMLLDGSYGQFAFSPKSYLFIYSFGTARSGYNDETMYYGNIICMAELTEPEEWKDSYWRAYYGYVVGDTYVKEDLDKEKIRKITVLTKKHMAELAKVLDSGENARKKIKVLDDFPLSV